MFVFPRFGCPALILLCLCLLKENRLPTRFHSRSSLRLLCRYSWLGLALPCVYFGAAGLAFSVRQHQANAARAGLRLPVLPAPTAATRLMVFAPHCDDETLGCAGLMQQTVQAGGKAQVVILTNGDGFRAAVECQTGRLRVEPQDYVRFADLRQQESLRALANLGVTADNVHFLGYPDQGLLALWNDNWTPDHLYTSLTTRCDHAPYAKVFRSQTAYCGQNVLDDIKAALRAFRPTLVTITHPSEDHADHAASAAFVDRALQELREDPQDAAWAKQTRLEHYLVHRGDWPLPQKSNAASPLLPPVELAQADTRWTVLPLTPAQTQRKAQSINLYPSQTAMMGRFLNAFAGSTELYGDLPDTHLATVPDGAIHGDARDADWQALPPCLLDPIRDNVLRDLQGSGDIRALYACHDSHYLYVRLDCRQPVSRRLSYSLHLRAFGTNGATAAHALLINLRPARATTTLANGIRLSSHNRQLEAAIPLAVLMEGIGEEEKKRRREDEKTEDRRQKAEGSQLSTINYQLSTPPSSLRTIAVSAETWGGIEIDKTGVRFLQVDR